MRDREPELVVARHAESTLGRKGLINGDPRRANPLTPRGVDQARALGRRLRDLPLAVCITTEFGRTIETADIALEGRDVARVVVPELNDPPQPGFDGEPLEGYLRWLGGSDWAETPPGGGESQLESVGRYLAGWRAALDYAEYGVAVVAHAFPISVALTLAHGDPPLLRRKYDWEVGLAQPHLIRRAALETGLDRLAQELAACV